MPVGISFLVLVCLSKTPWHSDHQTYKTGKSNPIACHCYPVNTLSVHQSNPVFVFTCPLNVSNQYGWRQSNVRGLAILYILKTRPKLHMDYEACIVSVSFGYAKKYASVLKKADITGEELD
jgi:hypothetical protein